MDTKTRLQEFFGALDQHDDDGELSGVNILSIYTPPNAPEYTTVGMQFPVAPGPCDGAIIMIHPALEEGSVLFFSITAIDGNNDRIPALPTRSFGSADEVIASMLGLMEFSRNLNDPDHTED